MSLASAAAVTPNMEKRPIAIMGDGGFWHNGLITGVASNLFNKGDGVLIVLQNGYASATGQQYIPSSTTSRDGPTPGVDIEQTLRTMGVKWLRTVHSYSVAVMTKTLKEAMRTAERGLKVIIADGECQLARQRRVRAEDAVKLERGERVTRTRYGVDDEICTGDHSCIRLSGCPSLTVKPSPDPLRSDPVATVIEVLRRLRAVRRGRACRRAVPVVLPRRDRAQCHLARPRAVSLAPESHRLARRLWRRGGGMSAKRPITLLIAALGGEGGGVLTDWIVSAAADGRLPGAEHLDPRRRPAHRRHHLLHRDFSGPRARARRQAPGAGAHARRRRHRHRGGKRIAGGRPHGGERLRHARAHASHRLAQPLLCHGREDRHGRRPLRPRQADQDHRGQCARRPAHRHGRARQPKRLDHQRGDARRHRRVAAAAADAPSNWKRRSAPTASRSTATCAASAPACTPRARKCGRRSTLEKKNNAPTTPELLEHEVTYSLPALAQPTAIEGVRRLIAYQGVRYAQLYLDRLRALVDADAASGTPGRLLKEVARQLAVRMSYEDVVRVAQAKIAPSRMRRIAREELHVQNEPFSVHDFLKPGIEEFSQLLPLVPGAAAAAPCGAQRLARPRLFRHGDQFHLDQRLFALPAAGQAAPLAPVRPSLQTGAGADRILARPDRRGGAALGRTRPRSRRMRPADQGLWRHLCARACQLPQHRGPRDPPGAGGPNPARDAPPTRSPARAPPLWSIPRAKAWPNAWPRSRARRVSAWRRSRLRLRCQPFARRVKHRQSRHPSEASAADADA